MLQFCSWKTNFYNESPSILTFATANRRFVINAIRLENLLELMASGMTDEEILADYEDLESEDLKTCFLVAAKLANVGSITEEFEFPDFRLDNKEYPQANIIF